MAYVKDFEHDIFISYAHDDNLPTSWENQGWIKKFYNDLNTLLIKRNDKPDVIKIWWDNRKLDGSMLFDQAIAEGIKKSAIMICINSPRYRASKYCDQELKLFYNKAQEEQIGLKVGNRSRIINVLLNNIPYNNWPKELEGTTGFPFHDSQDDESFGETVDTLSPEFRTQMKNLRDAVWNLLNEFQVKPDESPKQPDARKNNNDDFTIYLGAVADTLREPRKRVINELEKKGFTVITGIPPPDEVEAHEQETINALNNADLAVHLLDEFPGHKIIGAPEFYYPQKQTELALITDKSQMIWLPEETDFEDIEDEKYKAFLQNLENGTQVSKEIQFVRGKKSELAMGIIDFATQLKEAKAQTVVERGKFSVLLDTHYNDEEYAGDLYYELRYNQIRTLMNPQEDDVRKNMDLLKKRISQVKKLIFLYGSVKKEWLVERMNVAIQLILENNFPIEDIYLYLAPPHKEKDCVRLKQKFIKVKEINSSDNPVIDRVKLNELISGLKTAAV